PPTFKNGVLTRGYYTFGDGFPTNDLGQTLYLVDLSYALSLLTFAMTPTNVTFTNGSWNGPVRVLTPGSDFRLFATDSGNQVSSASDAFEVSLIDDIAVQIAPSADPTPVGESLAYS